MTEIIEINESTRLRVEQDTHAQCPRDDWDMMTGFINVPSRGDSRLSDVPAVHEDPTGKVLDAWERIVMRHECNNCAWAPHKPSTGPNPDFVIRWAHIFHGLTLEWDDAHGGFWFVSPSHDGVRMTTAAQIIEAERKTYEMWAEGEVYGVILERAVTKHISTVHADESVTRTTEEDWEEVESIWDCYLDDTYNAEAVAKEYWGVTK